MDRLSRIAAAIYQWQHLLLDKELREVHSRSPSSNRQVANTDMLPSTSACTLFFEIFSRAHSSSRRMPDVLDQGKSHGNALYACWIRSPVEWKTSWIGTTASPDHSRRVLRGFYRRPEVPLLTCVCNCSSYWAFDM